jgi:hypothetical protein
VEIRESNAAVAMAAIKSGRFPLIQICRAPIESISLDIFS